MIYFSFAAIQLFKKMILYFIHDHLNEDPKMLKELIRLVMTIDERIDSELIDGFQAFEPIVEAYNIK